MREERRTLSFCDAGKNDETLNVNLDALITSRLLIQANSGAGKSRALRQLLEQTHSKVQHFVFDPEGEFGTLREKYAYLLAGQEADVPAAPGNAGQLCRHLMEANASAIFDLSDLSLLDRRVFVREFLTTLIELPRELWRPVLVVIDEAHLFAPEGGDVESTHALINLCVLGRKRGYCAVVAVQRLSRLNKNVAAELANKMIGRTNLDVDMARAGAELGFDAKRRGTLKTLEPGQFYVYGPAICNDVTLIRTGEVETPHHQPGQVGLLPPPPPEALQVLIKQLNSLRSATSDDDAVPPGKKTAIREVIKEVPVYIFREGEVERLAAVADNLMGMAKDLADQAGQIYAALQQASPQVSPPTVLTPNTEPERLLEPVSERVAPPVVVPMPKASGKPLEIVPRQQRMLNVLAEYEVIGLMSVHRTNLAVESGQSHKSSAFQAHLSTLRDLRLTTHDGSRVSLTEKGRQYAVAAAAPPSRDALHQRWLARLTPAQQKFLRELIAVYPNTLTGRVLAQRAGYSPTSSTVGATITSLVDLGLASRPRPGVVQAGTVLFPRGLK
jgi:uncharacterized protein